MISCIGVSVADTDQDISFKFRENKRIQWSYTELTLEENEIWDMRFTEKLASFCPIVLHKLSYLTSKLSC